MLLFAATVLICFVNADGARNQAVLDLFQHEYHGDGTYYGNIKEGTCAYGTDLPPAATNPKIRSLVALNAPQFMGSLVCGLCLRVVGSGHGLGTNPISGEYIVFTKDLCPVCKAGDVDFALDGDGRWDIVIQAVQCPVGNTKIQYSFHGSNQWFVKLQIRNARIPITEVQLQRNGVWVTPNHNIDGHWLVSDSHEWQAGSIEIRMTAANGQTLEDTIPRIGSILKQEDDGRPTPCDNRNDVSILKRCCSEWSEGGSSCTGQLPTKCVDCSSGPSLWCSRTTWFVRDHRAYLYPI